MLGCSLHAAPPWSRWWALGTPPTTRSSRLWPSVPWCARWWARRPALPHGPVRRRRETAARRWRVSAGRWRRGTTIIGALAPFSAVRRGRRPSVAVNGTPPTSPMDRGVALSAALDWTRTAPSATVRARVGRRPRPLALVTFLLGFLLSTQHHLKLAKLLLHGLNGTVSQHRLFR